MDSDDPFLGHIWHKQYSGDNDQALSAGTDHRTEYLQLQTY